MEEDNPKHRAWAALRELGEVESVRTHCGVLFCQDLAKAFRHAKKAVGQAVTPAIEYLTHVPLEHGRAGGYSHYDYEDPLTRDIAAAVDLVAFSGDPRGIPALKRISSTHRRITVRDPEYPESWNTVWNREEREHAERALRLLQAIHLHGHTVCKKCAGRGTVICEACEGRGSREVTLKKKVFFLFTKEVTREINCYRCDGARRVECDKCDGTGKGVPELT